MTNPENITVIHTVQDAILQRLKQWLPSDFQIMSFPGNTETFDWAGHDKYCLVHLNGSKYDNRTGGARQMRVMQFQIVLALHNLQQSEEAYTHIEQIRKALQFQTFCGSQPVQMIDEQLASEYQGRWTWALKVAVTVPAPAEQTNRKISPILPNQQKESA